MKHALTLITALALLPGTVLLVGCGDPDLDDTEILDNANLDDPKVREMILKEAVESKSFERRGPILNTLCFQAGEQTPYTGWMKRIYDNGKVAMLGHIRGGKMDGPSIKWYENGQKITEHAYKAGKKEGLQTSWHSNGRKKSEATLKGGKKEGPETSWYENEKKSTEATFKDGIQVAQGTKLDKDGTGSTSTPIPIPKRSRWKIPTK